MTMYDGANNTSTDYATLLATANNTPSPQVCSNNTNSYWQYQAFQVWDQNELGTDAHLYQDNVPISTYPMIHMIDLGENNAVLINKYKLFDNINSGTSKNPGEWIFQGTNNVAASVNDAKNANGWTDLDTRTGITDFSSYFTFSCDTAYRFFRLRVTGARDPAQNGATDAGQVGEIKLVAENMLTVSLDVVFNSTLSLIESKELKFGALNFNSPMSLEMEIWCSQIPIPEIRFDWYLGLSPIVFAGIDLSSNFSSNLSMSVFIVPPFSKSFILRNALEMQWRLSLLNTLNFGFKSQFKFKNQLTEAFIKEFIMRNKLLPYNEVEKNLILFNRLLDEQSIQTNEYNGFYFSEISGLEL